ncbi:MAG: hypothetical protein FWG13_01795 [Leptospirales bacterium]|nr:hypothetical protein [Leptospirales bacterium]
MSFINKAIRSPLFFPLLLLSGIFAYYLYHVNYIAMPTEDYMGNFRPFVLSILSGNFSDISNKLLPAYPFLLAAVTKLLPQSLPDPIYSAALLVNMLLSIPFLWFAYITFRRFLGKNLSFFALLFLGLNLYTMYSCLNAELEIFLCTASVLALYLTAADSRLALASSALAGIIKWDSVFIIAAYALRVFAKTKKLLYLILSGGAAAIPLLAWMAFTMLGKNPSANTYIGEIAQRGPNIYKYPFDVLLSAAGFPRWLALDIYKSENTASSIIPAIILLAALAASLCLLALGVRAFIKTKDSMKLPVAVFASGFFIIHLIYQNTKDRYVIPIIWLLVLLMFLALSGNREKIKSKLFFQKALPPNVLYFAIAGIFFIQSAASLFKRHDIFIALFAVFFIAVTFFFLRTQTSLNAKGRLLVCLLAGTFCNLNIAYGANALDHFSLRRIEFKEAALYFKDNAPEASRLLISETSVPGYYIGATNHELVPTESLRSKNLEELEEEIREKKITHVFIDDFYITRLALNDPNAVDKKAALMKELRDAATGMNSLRLLKTFEAYSGAKAYLYAVTEHRP